MKLSKNLSKKIVGSERFLSLPESAQALYFVMVFIADNNGFVTLPTQLAGDIDTKILCDIGYVKPLAFHENIFQIADWQEHKDGEIYTLEFKRGD